MIHKATHQQILGRVVTRKKIGIGRGDFYLEELSTKNVEVVSCCVLLSFLSFFIA